MPFLLSENEIKEAFSTLDFKKLGYITTEEINFFLDLIGEKVTEEEL